VLVNVAVSGSLPSQPRRLCTPIRACDSGN
jgi:hypothetical protein